MHTEKAEWSIEDQEAGYALPSRFFYDEVPVGVYQAFWQVGGTHQAHFYSATGNATTFDQAGFPTYDASLGVAKDPWAGHLYIDNLTDTRANLYENSSQFVNAITVNRPRTGGVRFSDKF